MTSLKSSGRSDRRPSARGSFYPSVVFHGVLAVLVPHMPGIFSALRRKEKPRLQE